jgi:hypothetical protein
MLQFFELERFYFDHVILVALAATLALGFAGDSFARICGVFLWQPRRAHL